MSKKTWTMLKEMMKYALNETNITVQDKEARIIFMIKTREIDIYGKTTPI